MVIDAGSLTVSADYFRIALSDRLALSQSFKLEPDEADRLIAEGITSAKNLANFRFFTNQFNTRTQGVDLVASFVPAGMGGDTEFSLAINHTATTVTSYNPAVLDEVRIRQLEDALPGTRWTTSARRTWGDLSLLGRLSYYAGWFDSRDDRDYPGEYLDGHRGHLCRERVGDDHRWQPERAEPVSGGKPQRGVGCGESLQPGDAVRGQWRVRLREDGVQLVGQLVAWSPTPWTRSSVPCVVTINIAI